MTESPIPVSCMKIASLSRYTMLIVIVTNMSRMPIHPRWPMRFCSGARLAASLANGISFSGGTFGRKMICMMSTNTKNMLMKNGTCHPMTASVPDKVENTMAMMLPTAFAPPIMLARSLPAKKYDISVGTMG